MADSTTTVDQLAVSQANLPTRINELVDALSAALVYGRRAAATTGLTWGYFGGRNGGTSVANGTLTLTASSTNHIVVNKATKAVSTSTAASNWNDTGAYARAYKAVTGTTGVSSYEDHRFGEFGVLANVQTATVGAFTDLTDAPASYAGHGGKAVKVKSDETGLEFVAAADVVALNAQTGTSYTLALSDATRCVEMTNGGANTVTVPPNSDVAFPVGSMVFIAQGGTGADHGGRRPWV